MEGFLKDFELEDKDRSIDALSRWRSAVSLVKNPRRRFRNAADLGKRVLLDEKQVAEELLNRRKETEWFIEGDFDTYVTRIQQTYVWGGEPELLMASHVLKTPIYVFMRDASSMDLVNIAKYGEEYMNDEEISINVLFHRHGHYELLETL